MAHKIIENSILITGSNGFIGKNLIAKLLPDYRIFAINKSPDVKRSNYFPKTLDISKLLPHHVPNKFSAIIHMAAATDVIWCQNNPRACSEINIGGTQKLLEIARKKDCKFVYLSTAHVYGKPSHNPMREEDPTNPESIYAGTKLAGEIICESYSKSYGLDIDIVRLFSVYGPYSSPHLVTMKIISQLENNVVSLGNIKTKRDFIFVDDVTNAIKVILKKSNGFNRYNVGTGKGTSIKQLCCLIKEISKKHFVIKSQNNLKRKNDVLEIISDNSRLRDLGWAPKTDLRHGIRIMLDWYYNKQ